MTQANHRAIVDAGDTETSVAYFKELGLDRGVGLLDVGARYGSFLSRLQHLGYTNTVGIDVDRPAVELGVEVYPELSSRLMIYEGEVIPFRDEAFDVITMFDVLEHIPQVAGFLNDVQRVLKPSGLFVFQTPNLFINAPWEIIQRRSLTFWRTYHVSLQSLWSLRKLLQEAGFREVHIEKFSLGSDHKKNEARRVFGPIGPLLLSFASRMPLSFYPNFWGTARKGG